MFFWPFDFVSLFRWFSCFQFVEDPEYKIVKTSLGLVCAFAGSS